MEGEYVNQREMLKGNNAENNKRSFINITGAIESKRKMWAGNIVRNVQYFRWRIPAGQTAWGLPRR